MPQDLWQQKLPFCGVINTPINKTSFFTRSFPLLNGCNLHPIMLQYVTVKTLYFWLQVACCRLYVYSSEITCVFKCEVKTMPLVMCDLPLQQRVLERFVWSANHHKYATMQRSSSINEYWHLCVLSAHIWVVEESTPGNVHDARCTQFSSAVYSGYQKSTSLHLECTYSPMMWAVSDCGTYILPL